MTDLTEKFEEALLIKLERILNEIDSLLKKSQEEKYLIHA
jgi:hypothetical protein